MCPLSKVSYNTRCKASRVAPIPPPPPSSQIEQNTPHLKPVTLLCTNPGLLLPLDYKWQTSASPPLPKLTHLIHTHTHTYSHSVSSAPAPLPIMVQFFFQKNPRAQVTSFKSDISATGDWWRHYPTCESHSDRCASSVFALPPSSLGIHEVHTGREGEEEWGEADPNFSGLAYKGRTLNATALHKVERGFCPVCLGSDKSSGGAHGVLWTEVDIVLLLPVDPVGPWTLPVWSRRGKKVMRKYVQYETLQLWKLIVMQFWCFNRLQYVPLQSLSEANMRVRLPELDKSSEYYPKLPKSFSAKFPLLLQIVTSSSA